MVTQLGMSDLGPIMFGSGHSDTEVFLGRDFSHERNYSEAVAAQIDEQIEKIITEAYNEAKRLLSENIDKLHFIAKYLVKNEIMDGEQFKRAMEEDGVTIEDLEEMVAERRRRYRSPKTSVSARRSAAETASTKRIRKKKIPTTIVISISENRNSNRKRRANFALRFLYCRRPRLFR